MAPIATNTTSSSQTTTTTPIKVSKSSSSQPVLRLRLNGTDATFGDWRDDLIRDGYAVVKGAVPRENAKMYAEAYHEWLESFGMGYDRNDPSTIKKEKMPYLTEKGMALHYGVAHEDFVWGIRSEPGVIHAFEQVYGTEDLLVSFDAINMQFPNRTDMPENKPWPHQDQDPSKPGFRCLQGLVNLLPNGPNDGGLIVCKGGHMLSEQFHKEMKDEERIPAWTPEWYGYTERGMKWLKDHGCEWVKVEAEPGDLIVWDSRAPHYNLAPKGDTPRFACYTCFLPVAEATQADLIRKKDAFERRLGTTHWPTAQHVGDNKAVVNRATGEVHNGPERLLPRKDPVLNDRAFKLTGIPYIKAQE